MKNILLAFGVSLLCYYSYAQKSINLSKVIGKKSEIGATMPLSVVEIPAGTFIMGNHGDSTSSTSQNQQRPVLISGFYMSATEVTNAQYHEFVNWVRDSIVAKRLGGQYVSLAGNDTTINWSAASKINYSDPAVLSQLGDLVLNPAKTISARRILDPDKLIYAMEGFNYQEAAKKATKGRDASDFMYRYTVQVYPDTLAWMRDFGYSNNEQMAVNYFSSPKYQNYPVVGVSWKQASAFCDWLTKHKMLEKQKRKAGNAGGKARLPTEAEWEFAARGGLQNDIYPWGNEPINQGKPKANSWGGKFPYYNDDKDGFIGLAPVKSFPSNGYKLFDMAGNVWEWCSDWYDANYYKQLAGKVTTNPQGSDQSYDPQEPSTPKKSLRGGSFLCNDNYCSGYRAARRMKSSRDTGLEHTGFRCVKDL